MTYRLHDTDDPEIVTSQRQEIRKYVSYVSCISSNYLVMASVANDSRWLLMIADDSGLELGLEFMKYILK